MTLIVDRVSAQLSFSSVHVGAADRYTQQASIAKIVHHPRIERFLPVSVKVRTIIQPDVEMVIGVGVRNRHPALQEEALVAAFRF